MNAWTNAELDGVVGSLQPLIGCRLQEVQTSDGDVVLGFFVGGGLHWLWIDLSPVRPCLLPFTSLPLKPRAVKSPLQLFLRAHFVDRIVKDIYRDEHEGRVVHLGFGRADDVDAPNLEIRLFPHGRNVVARALGKQIAWQKPRPLSEEVAPLLGTRPARDLETLRAEWLAARGGSKISAGQNHPSERLRNDLDRKRKALVKVEEELTRKREMPWKELGEWLKREQSLAVPREWEPFVDKRRNLAWNIEDAFRRGRELDAKLIGTEKRLDLLKREIAVTEEKLKDPVAARQMAVTEKPARQPLREAGADGRTLRLTNELVAVQGKNASDNLKLLRKARAWDLWIHLRDSPSSHAILFRNKNSLVNDEILMQVAAWFVRNHLGPKLSKHQGERFELMVTECRFVRPIKGDKTGRVNYSNERTLVYRL